MNKTIKEKITETLLLVPTAIALIAIFYLGTSVLDFFGYTPIVIDTHKIKHPFAEIGGAVIQLVVSAAPPLIVGGLIAFIAAIAVYNAYVKLKYENTKRYAAAIIIIICIATAAAIYMRANRTENKANDIAQYILKNDETSKFRIVATASGAMSCKFETTYSRGYKAEKRDKNTFNIKYSFNKSEIDAIANRNGNFCKDAVITALSNKSSELNLVIGKEWNSLVDTSDNTIWACFAEGIDAKCTNEKSAVAARAIEGTGCIENVEQNGIVKTVDIFCKGALFPRGLPRSITTIKSNTEKGQLVMTIEIYNVDSAGGAVNM